MKNTRIISLFLSLLLVFSAAFTLASCTDTPSNTVCTEHKDNNGDGVCDTEGCTEAVPTTPSSDCFNEKGELFLFKDGIPTFKIVVGADAAPYMMDVKELAEDIARYTKDEIEPEIVSYDSTISEVEILIGDVQSRGGQHKINKYDYGNTGYTVKQIGSKIVVVGGSDEALLKALDYLKTTVLGISGKTSPYGDFVMSEKNAYDVKQSDYTLTDITIDGASIRSYVITYSDTYGNTRQAATKLQTELYDKCGIRLDIITETKAVGMKKIAFRSLENDGVGGGFYVSVDKDKNLVLECEFGGMKFQDLAMNYFNDNVFNKSGAYAIPQELTYAPDCRNVTYEQYGAVGDGVTDDFFAIKAAHDDANTYMLIVHANPDATYLIGNANKTATINVRTNTYWHGCKFIFDDEEVSYKSDARTTPIFSIRAEKTDKMYSSSKLPFTSLEAGAENVGWAPGVKLMISVRQSSIRHFIRYGTNASQSSDQSTWGEPQHELILIDENGNVDPSTPVQWTYTKITSITVYYVYDDAPIEIVGERYDENGNEIAKTTITTWYNNGPSTYFYYARNIQVTRSNVKISGVEHKYDKYVRRTDGGSGSPYNGFISVENANNVVFDNFILECPPAYKDTETTNRPSGSPTPTNGSMGSYEMSAEHSNNVTWSNVKERNFFTSLGNVIGGGNMGTNFCKNLVFDNVFNCSFDAHCGVYNGTIKNSTLEHINFIGGGLIKLENVTVYTDSKHAAINLRTDYGSSWSGDVEIDGLILKHKATDKSNIGIIRGVWNNWSFGYKTYLPQNITLKNVLTAGYTFELVGEGNGNSNRVESNDYIYNDVNVTAFYGALNNPSTDYSAETIEHEPNLNPMAPTKNIYLYTEYTGIYATLGIKTAFKFTPPSGAFYKNTKYYIDGILG